MSLWPMKVPEKDLAIDFFVWVANCTSVKDLNISNILPVMPIKPNHRKNLSLELKTRHLKVTSQCLKLKKNLIKQEMVGKVAFPPIILMKCCLKLELIQNLSMIVQYVKFNAILKRYLMYIYKDQNTKKSWYL